MKKQDKLKVRALSLFCVGLFFMLGILQADPVLAATVTVGQTASKASATYFYYNPSGRNAYAVINNAINAAASGASANTRGVVNIENASSPYLVDSHILAKSNVNINGASRGGVTLKIASGITPVGYGGPGTTGWGGPDSSESCGAIINVWTGITNVNISNLTLDGSSDDYYANIGRGYQEFPLMNLHGAVNVVIDNVKFTRGADNGMWGNGSSNVEIKNCVFNMIGHDFIEGYNINNLKFHHNIGAMRTNSGVRCAGASNGCYIYDNEFYTGTGGGAALELQNTVTNVKVYNNYFHDISGASGSYGAIGYPGQSPTGSGHEYYNNLFVNMPYAVAHVPSSAVSRNNIMINCSTTVGGGTDTNNIKTASGYVFAKSGTNGQGNTYWMVTSGPLTSVFAGIQVGIESKAGGSDDATPGTVTEPDAARHTLTIDSGTGSGSYLQGEIVTIVANPTIATKIFDKWTGDTGYVSSVSSGNTTVKMPNRAIKLTANYKDSPVLSAPSLTASVVPNTVTSVEKGATNVQLIAIKFTNTGSEALTLSGIVVPGVYSPINETNTALYLGSTKLAPPTNRTDSQVTFSGLSIQIVKGATIVLAVKGDIATSNIKTTMVYPMCSNTGITAKGTSTAAVRVTALGGSSTLTIKAGSAVVAGAMTVAVVPNTVTAVEKGATNVQLISLKLTNTGTEDLKLSPFGIALQGVDPDSDFIDYVANTAFYIDGVKLAGLVQTDYSLAAFYNSTFQLEKGKSVIFTVKGDIVKTISSTSLTFSTLAKNDTSNVKMIDAKGVTSGKAATIMPEEVKSVLGIKAAPAVAGSLTASVVPNTITAVEKGATNVQLIAIKLTNTGGDDINVTGVEISGSYAPINESNTTLYMGETKLGTPSTRLDSRVIFTGLNLVIVKGASVTLTLKGDIAKTNTRTSMSFSIEGSSVVKATGVTSRTAPKITIGASSSTLTIKAASASTAALSATLIPNAVTSVDKGTAGAQLIAYKFTNTGTENLLIKGMGFTGDFKSSSISGVTMYINDKNIGVADKVKDTGTVFSTLEFVIAKGESFNFTLKGNISPTAAAGIKSFVLDKSGCILVAKGMTSGKDATVTATTTKSSLTVKDGVATSIKDGAIIRAYGDIDVYIVKLVGNKRFIRVILSPSVFRSYGHLKWENVIVVDKSVIDSYTVSNLVYVAGNASVWKLDPQGDNGKKTHNTVTGYDLDSVYEVNAVDLGSYL